ncbi:zinc ABC transporter substrate-binding protein [Mycolicibacterium flavescens]|uniref:ABC transporter substrate-binding protein n=2 Tax=Mycolicibacterium flavescens TaxID=1776 RepID=A0A1E3RA73_MYCFV|nr:zinc ABC transporter substrate-binding protein [Mycolicibacterium flavescens]ODQ86828.1 ABC transporter substrate-binding protein [Mycolicibacterium flavescens]
METVIVIAMFYDPRLVRVLAACAVLAVPLAGCSDDGDRAAPQGACPVAPVDVVVSVDQWGDLVERLGGDCAQVTTVIASSSVDPHDYEPTPADAATFEGAQLVVLNGGHYDEWAAKLAAGAAPDAPVVEALAADHDHDHEHDHDHDHGAGANPHAWYDPAAVTAVADAVRDRLSALAPEAAGYFAERRRGLATALTPYDERIESIRAGASRKTYAATETVFDDMAAALGLTNRTPAGYQVASANESEPSPADLDAFLRLLEDRGVDVLIYNVQTEGSVPQQIRAAAEQAGVPVVEVTETVPPDTDSFVTWQVDQLTALAEALGVRT